MLVTVNPLLEPSTDNPISLTCSTDDEAGHQQQHAASDKIGWTILSTTGPTPCERQWASVVVLRHHIYVFGGFTKRNSVSKYLGDFFQYDSQLRKWTDLSNHTNHPAARHSATIVAHGNRLYLFGGCGEGQVPLADLWLYDITMNKWTRVKKDQDFITNTQDQKQVYKKGSRVVFDPCRLQSNLTMSGLFTSSIQSGPISKSMGQTMNSSKMSMGIKDDWPRARYSHSAVVYNDNMYVYGGWMTDWSKGELLWRLDLTNLTWNEVELSKPSPIPDRRFGHISAVWDHRLYIFGGNRSTKTTSEMWAFHLLDRRWIQIESTGSPGPRKWHTGVVVENFWVIHGGVSGEVFHNDPDIRNDSFSFDFRSSNWTLLPHLIVKNDNQPIDCHSGCIVSTEFSYSFFLLFGRRRNVFVPPPSQEFVLDFFRPSAHLQIEDDEMALYSASRFIEQRSVQFFRSNIDQLTEQLDSLRNTFEEDIMPSLEKHLQKVANKISSSKGEPDDIVLGVEESPCPNLNWGVDDAFLLKKVFEGLIDTDRLYQENRSDLKEISSVSLFVNLLATEIDSNEEELERFLLQEDSLSLEKSQILKRMIRSLHLIEEYRSEIVAEFVMPAVEQAQDIHDLPLSKVIKSFIYETNEAADIYYKSTEFLKEGNLQSKQRRTLEMQKTEAGKILLTKLHNKMVEILQTLKAPPLGEEICIEKLLESYGRKKKSIEDKLATCKKGSAKQEKVLSFLDKVEGDKRRLRLDALSQFEEKRVASVLQRSALIDEIRTFLETKLEAYGEILLEERRLILEAELYKRETDEMARRISEMKQSAERPRLQKIAFQSALSQVVVPVLDTLMEEQKETLNSLENAVGQHYVAIAEETARDVARFRRLMDDVHQQLENQLELQENSLKMVQSRIESKRELVEMLTTSAGKHSIGENEGTSEEVEAQIEQLELTLANLHTEISVSRKGLSEMNELSNNFESNIATLKQANDKSLFPSSCSMRQIVTSGFDWENALKSAFSTMDDSFNTWIVELAQSSHQHLSPIKGTPDAIEHHARGLPRQGRPVRASVGRSVNATFAAPAKKSSTAPRSLGPTFNRLDINRIPKRMNEPDPKNSPLPRFAESHNLRVRGTTPIATVRTPSSRR